MTATLDLSSIRRRIAEFSFKELFIELLGWDPHQVRPMTLSVDNATYTLSPIAQKRGLQVFECSPRQDGGIPDSSARMKIEREVTKSAREHLIVFVDGARTTQSSKAVNHFSSIFKALMADYNKHSVLKQRRDGVKYQEFYPSASKPLIDKIDRALAHYYDLSPDELDFIINYDIKYRMGREADEEGDESA